MSGPGLVRVWDPVVRIGHWSLAMLFAAAYASGELDAPFHVYVGYAVLALVVFRILWGFVGTRHARFADFLRGPRATLGYLLAFAAGRPPHFLGHNPAGGWMIVALLSVLLCCTWTGMETFGAKGEGPLAQGGAAALFFPASAANDRVAPPGEGRGGRKRRSPAERFWKELHEGFINTALLLVLLHVAGAVSASVVHRENLVRAMVTGDKLAPPP